MNDKAEDQPDQGEETTPAPTQAAAETKPDEKRPWREAWPARLRWLADHCCPLRPDPPDDAEPPVRPRRRDGWSPVLRGFADVIVPVPWDPPERFPQSLDTLRERLATTDGGMADELIRDAEGLFAEADARVESAERRATTLQGTVAIAATVALAGGGLLVDPNKIHGGHWQTAFALGLGVLVLLLVLTALRAVGASSRVFSFTTPSDDDIFERAKAPTAEAAKTRRAAYLLHGYGRNNEVAALKVGYLKAASFWFRGALLALLVLTSMLAAYVVDTRDRDGLPKPTPPRTATKTMPKPHPKNPPRTRSGPRSRPSSSVPQ